MISTARGRTTAKLLRSLGSALCAGVLATGGLVVAGGSAAYAAAPERVAPTASSALVTLPPADSGPSAVAGSAAGTVAAVSAIGARAVKRPSAAAPPQVVLQGHGAGNGVGLGQWGAYGYATTDHESWEWIVAHYYAGTTLEPLAGATDAEDIDVDLTQLDKATVTQVKAAQAGATITVNGDPRPSAVAVTHIGALKVVKATAGDVGVDLPGVGWRYYQGTIDVEPDGRTWNVVPLEDYVAGVIPAESPASWGSVAGGEAALQSQAVATRSYALAYVAANGAICDTVECQVYAGDPAYQDLGAYAANVTEAATSTAGRVVCTVAAATCPATDVALAQFGASTGGWTEASAPFSSVVDAGDAVAGNPYHDWVAGGACPTTFPASKVAKDFGLATLTSAQVTSRTGEGTWGGRAVTVVFTGTNASGQATTVTTSGDTVEWMLGLCSNWFSFSQS